jgi:hypothetical protein
MIEYFTLGLRAIAAVQHKHHNIQKHSAADVASERMTIRFSLRHEGNDAANVIQNGSYCFSKLSKMEWFCSCC